VRFRKADIAALESLPSAGGSTPLAPKKRRRSAVGRGAMLAALALVGVVAVLAGTLYLAGVSGIGNERIRREAESALAAYVGVPVRVEAGAARISLGETGLLALEIPDVQLTVVEGDRAFARAGAMGVGIALRPLLSGRVEVSEIVLREAVIDRAALPAREGPDWLDGIRDDRGLLDPDRLVGAVFGGINRLFDALGDRHAPRIVLRDVALVAAGGEEDAVYVRLASAWRDADERLALDGEIEVLGRPVSLSGYAARPAGGGALAFDLALDVARLAGAVAQETTPWLDGTASLRLTGNRQVESGRDSLRIAASGRDLSLVLPEMEPLGGDVDVSAVLETGAGKLEFERLALGIGRSSFVFHGAVGPVPREAGALQGYRWEFNSDGSVAAASDVPEPALQFIARIAGTYDPAAGLLSADEIGIRTRPGELYGRASMQFLEGRSPGIALAIDVPTMPVSHAKQLWPAPTAPGARAWVLKNVFGGMIENSRVRFRVEPGRLGNGIALDGDEVNGHFAIADTRFDITGELPAVRDATGAVDFRGSDVDVSLSQGTVYMPTGRTLAASNGSFLIRHVESRPSTGFMDIDVMGEAPAAIEFASYRPINAMRHLGLAPDDFSGQVTGNVKAEIPLRLDFPIEELDWQVDLAYENLAIAKPFEGQAVSEAHGTVEVDPRRALIKATAKLNGVPAEIAMTEPLSEAGPERARDVSLVLDDAARQAIAPGLNTMLSGPVAVQVEVVGPGVQRMTADLRDATVSFPWIGWTKGRGVPGAASFLMTQEEDRITLSDFELSGETFSAKGEIRLSAGELAEARLSNVSLNRGDEVAVIVARAGKGYDVRVDGPSLDARSVIKLYLAETDKAEKAVESVPITLQAKLGRAVGFGNEVLSGVTVDLGGTGTDLGTLRITATTAAGAAVGIVNKADAGGRNVSIRSADAGTLLRFLNIYEYMQGGSIDLALAARGDGPLRGQIEARDFWLVNDPRLRSLISAPPPQGDGRSLSQVVQRDIDDRKAHFERGFALVEKGDGRLSIDRGVLRGPVIGATFQGVVYDERDTTDITGTFMPAYGVNRLFGEIPLIGQILGNGRDRGLIGITFRLAGDVKSPQIQVNPISAIAPGIFRSIFEFN
jgi:hypothetical protein